MVSEKNHMTQAPSVGVAIITHNAKHHLPNVLPPLLNSPLRPKVLVVNSSSEDGTLEAAKAMGAETLKIPRKNFNHGSTRELARCYLGTELVVMMTPDAYAQDQRLLTSLLQPLINKQASIAYARQIPHKGANFFESFSRFFNYPEKSHIRSIKDIETYGVYTFFSSNSCAAYLNSALDEIGGFQPVLLGEDTIAAAKLLQRGHKIAYVAEAIVCHSHNYSLKQEFKRNFDIGLARKQHQEIIAMAGKDHRRGMLYTKQLFSLLYAQNPSKIPYAVAQTLFKWTGYQLGRLSLHAPKTFKKMCSSQDFYWE